MSKKEYTKKTKTELKSQVLNKEVISRRVSEALGLPYEGRWGRSYKLVKIVLNTIVEALQRGEEVSIPGLGVFKVRALKSRKSACVLHYHQTKPKVNWELRSIPEKQYVHFQPSKALIRFINNDAD